MIYGLVGLGGFLLGWRVALWRDDGLRPECARSARQRRFWRLGRHSDRPLWWYD